MKKNLSKTLVSGSLLVILLGAIVAGFIALSKEMEDVISGFDFED
jgi:hypothetical protein